MEPSGDAVATGVVAGAMIWNLICLGVAIVVIASLWKIFAKAGRPGWAAIVPIYNIIVLLDIVEQPIWWIVLFFIPVVNIVISFIVYIALAEKFGRGAGFGIGLALLPVIFFPILGFGDAAYIGYDNTPRTPRTV